MHAKISKEAFVRLRDSQRPFAVILGCSDSRVPPELVFDQGFGDLFVIRLAGNIIAPGVAGSIQYAYQHLGTSLLVVLGHEGCGAVKAALSAKFQRAKHPERIQQLVDLIEPGLEDIDPQLSAGKQLEAGVEANVRWSMQQVIRAREAEARTRKKGKRSHRRRGLRVDDRESSLAGPLIGKDGRLMTWIQRYRIRHYIQNSLWVLPVLGTRGGTCRGPLAALDRKGPGLELAG